MTLSLILSAAILLLGMASGWLSGSGNRSPWFATIAKPWFMPPGWAFPLVWTILYLMMGVALAQVVRSHAPERPIAIGLFLAQLALNLAWSPIFFAAHRIRFALAVMILLDAVVVATVVLFARIGAEPALLLAPYLLWLILATALNAAIVRLNR
jgi:benzodiazapine receptor